MNEIRNISIDDLSGHPRNPRRNIGDVTELADSVRTSGILQNLTVIPSRGEDGNIIDGKYTVIIGHRRLAAARMAGLTELPCVITDMSEQEAIQTMLVENMQRESLTVVEEAEGFQYMLGCCNMTVSDIAKKTGFSETKIRTRIKMTELDREKLQKSVEKGGTITEYLELNKVASKERRDSLLQYVGTSEFMNQLKKALFDEETEAACATVRASLDSFASVVDAHPGYDEYDYIKSISKGPKMVFELPEDAMEREYKYTESSYSFTLYGAHIEKAKTPEELREKMIIDHFKEYEARIDRAAERFKELRGDFLRDFTADKKYKDVIIAAASKFHKLMADSYNACIRQNEAVKKYKGIEEDEKVEEYIASEPALSLLMGIIRNLETSRNLYHARTYGKEDEKYTFTEQNGMSYLRFAYEILESIGYETSHEEKDFLDGTTFNSANREFRFWLQSLDADGNNEEVKEAC